MSGLKMTREQVLKESHECRPNSVLDNYTMDWLEMHDLLSTLSENTGMTNEPWQEWRDKIRALIGE